MKNQQSQQGGGNDPSCGCDLQAGWPSTLPRGGLQGGGVKHANVSLSWETNNGKTHRYKGHIQRNGSQSNHSTTNRPSASASASNSNYKKVAYKGKALLVSNTGNAYTRKKNGTMGSYLGTMMTNANGKRTLVRSTASRNVRSTARNSNRMTAAPPPLEELNEMNEINTYDELEDENSLSTESMPLSQSGGRRHRHTRKHRKGCKCLICMLKFTRKRR